MPDTKKCPHCAEEIKVAAKTCRYCGKSVKEGPGCGTYLMVGVAFLVGGIVISHNSNTPEGDPKPLPAEKVAECRAAIDDGIDIGWIAKREGATLYVNDREWHKLSVDTKGGLMRTFVCEYYAYDRLLPSQAVYVHSNFTGKRLATYSMTGLDIE